MFEKKNAKDRAFSSLRIGLVFTAVMGEISAVGLRAAHAQYERCMATKDCFGLTRTTMEYSRSHEFRMRGNRPLSVADFDTH